MHEIVDTEDADSAQERFWPEGYKSTIRRLVHQNVLEQLQGEKAFYSIYEMNYRQKFPDFGPFLARLADMVVIGAENGAEEAFDEIYAAFRAGSPLPQARSYARYFWPQALTEETREELHRAVVNDYLNEHAYTHFYEGHYAGRYPRFEAFVEVVGHLGVLGVERGADDMLGEIYRAFMIARPLPPARRRPRRLRAG